MTRAIYEATLALLRGNSIYRLDLGPTGRFTDFSIGLHAGWDDGEFVIMASDNAPSPIELAFSPNDTLEVRALADALTAYADWCEETGKTPRQREPGSPAT